MTTTPPSTSSLLALARAAQAVEAKRVTTGIDVSEHAPPMAAFREACTPDVVAALCERVETLESRIATLDHELAKADRRSAEQERIITKQRAMLEERKP